VKLYRAVRAFVSATQQDSVRDAAGLLRGAVMLQSGERVTPGDVGRSNTYLQLVAAVMGDELVQSVRREYRQSPSPAPPWKHSA